MTTKVKIHVNGRYRATIKQSGRDPVVVDGNYDGSPNPTGDGYFTWPWPDVATFEISEEPVPEEANNAKPS